MKKCNFKIGDRGKATNIKLLDLIWCAGIPILNINYFLASRIAKSGYDLTISVDKLIPFVPIFILPYIYWYIYIIIGLIFILIKAKKEYIRTLISIFIGMCICYLIYYLFPTEFSRPIVDNTNIINKLINFIYYTDKPFNCFPSLHVLLTYCIMRYTKRDYSKITFYYTQIVGILIILSTVFIKQHFVVDIFSSIVLCEIVMYGVKKIDNRIISGILDLPYKIKI